MLNVIKTLQATDEKLEYNPLLKMCAQVLLRDKWNSCFRAIEANDGELDYHPPKTLDENYN